MRSNPSASASQIETLTAENARLRRLLRQAGLDPEPGEPIPTCGCSCTPDEPPATWQPSEEQGFIRLLIDSLSEGFYAVDVNGRATLCNTALLRILGFEREEDVIGKKLHGLIHHSHADGSPYPVEDCPIYRAAREGLSTTMAGEVFFRADGTSFPVEYRAAPIIRDGELMGAICTFADITERVQAAADLKDSRARLALALDSAGIGVWDFSPSTGELQWDNRVRQLFGLSPGQPIGVGSSLKAIHPTDRPLVEAALATAFDPAGTGTYDMQFRVHGIEDGKERWAAAKGRVTFAGGEVQRFLGVVRDISEEKRAEEHLRLLVNELNHRVKNSLAMVQGVAAQTLRGTDDIAAARKAFNERLVALARAHDVLTAGHWEGAGLTSVVGLTVKSHAGEDGHRFEVEGPDIALSPKTVLAIALALHELATNAVKYGALSNDSGTVRISWRAEEAEDGKRLIFVWEERGGPAVIEPRRRGFGSKLIERGLAAELQGEVRIDFRESGVVCTISAPFPSP
jgi:PAS domain S-box-containing protein